MELKDALAQSWRGWQLSEKMDGRFAVRQFAGCTVTGEAMRDGRFYAWDIATAFGEDIRRRQWPERDEAITELFNRLPPKLNWHRPATGHGAEFIEAVLHAGGEGVVAKPNWGYFGIHFTKIKRVETFDVKIVTKHPTKYSVAIEYDGQPAGNVAVLFGRYDEVAPGDVIEIAAYGRTAKGCFREPRFIRTRKDKA
jgi:ATP-dependent DNA ligase